MTRRPATTVVALLLPVPLLVAAPSYADRPVTGRVGGVVQPEAEASCPAGWQVTGIGVYSDGQVAFGVRPYCRPLDDPAGVVGTTVGSEAFSYCDSGDRTVGLHGTSTEDGIQSLGMFCSGPQGDYLAAGVGGGGASFSTTCPPGTELSGIRGSSGSTYLTLVQGLCSVPTTTTVAIADRGPNYPGETVALESTTTPDVAGYDAPTGAITFALPGETSVTTLVEGRARVPMRLAVAPEEVRVRYAGDASNIFSPVQATVGSDVLTDTRGPGPFDGSSRDVVTCPLGSEVTGVDWTASDSTTYLRGVRLHCDGTSFSAYAGGPTDGATTFNLGCDTGDRVVGFRTRSGAIVDAAEARCARADGMTYGSGVAGNAGGGADDGATDCPAGAVLLGLTVDWGIFDGEGAVYGLQGICGDSTAPVVRVRPVPAVTLGAARPASWSGSDALTGVEGYLAITQRTVSTSTPRAYEYVDRPGGSRGSVTVRNLRPGQTACVHVSATDGAGNVSDRTRGVCTSRPFDERAATASKGWTWAKNRSAYLRTTMVSRTKGATLSLRTVGLSRVGVVATTCPACGSLTVLAGSRTLGTINLRSARTRYQRVLLLPARTTAAGLLRLRVASTGKPVTVDGIVATAVYQPIPG